MDVSRLFRHLTVSDWTVRRAFDSAALNAIERAITATELTHGGEIRFAVEGNLSVPQLFHGLTSRARALQVFGALDVWDTDANNGVLIYVLWADHAVEIIADRGFNGRVSEREWVEVCRRIEELMRAGDYSDAAVQAIKAVGTLIARDFPAADRNELPDRPVIL
jgi:uncharacterized membrane protein YgcG